jgi:uncharacterized protein YndB with AHSA1/START domain
MTHSSTQPGSRDGSAATIKKAFSRETSIRIRIQAIPSIVWALLTNAEDYPRWNSTIISMKGEIREGGQIELKSTLDEKRTFKLKIKDYVPETTLVWGDNMGSRVYTISPEDAGVVFYMSEKIGGPLFPLFSRFLPSFDESFEQFAADLKKEAESVQAAS